MGCPPMAVGRCGCRGGVASSSAEPQGLPPRLGSEDGNLGVYSADVPPSVAGNDMGMMAAHPMERAQKASQYNSLIIANALALA